MKIIKTQNRFIKTKIPAPGTFKIIKSLTKSESRSMQGQLPIIWSKAEGHSLVDIGGNKFIDFMFCFCFSSVVVISSSYCDCILFLLSTLFKVTYQTINFFVDDFYEFFNFHTA